MIDKAAIPLVGVLLATVSAGHVAAADKPQTARIEMVGPSEPRMLTLPAGGDEFRRALLEWSASPVAMRSGEQLELPVPAPRFSSRFGMRHDPLGGKMRAHLGIDIPDVMGAPVRAAAGGTVVFAGWSRGYGNLIQIDHGRGSETRYGHLSAITVQSGDLVIQGAMIGSVGSTGRSTGPHLHFEVRQDGLALNPLTRLRSGVADIAVVEPVAQAHTHWGGFGEINELPQARLR